MADDYHNGLTIVPLDENNDWRRKAQLNDAQHPWSFFFPKGRYSNKNSSKPPGYYSGKKHHAFRDEEIQETLRLKDVDYFRSWTSEKLQPLQNPVQRDFMESLLYCLLKLFCGIITIISKLGHQYRNMIYRNTGAVHCINGYKYEIFEAIHYEIFMPDRFDLRFILVSDSNQTAEGDLIRVQDAAIIGTPSIAVKLGQIEYPIVWLTSFYAISRIELEALNEKSGLAYTLPNEENMNGGVRAVSEISDKDFLIPSNRYPLQGNGVVNVTMKNMITAQLYSVEPISAFPIEYHELTRCIPLSSRRSGLILSAVYNLSATEAAWVRDKHRAYAQTRYSDELKIMDKVFRLGATFRAHAESVNGRNAKDVPDICIDESVIVKTLTDNRLSNVYPCRTLDEIYGYHSPSFFSNPFESMLDFFSRNLYNLNEQQSRAVRDYADIRGPRVMCVRSPPGSGKTTVAAAMAVEVVKQESQGVQLLLSVQNVAVDNMGEALKKWTYKRPIVYNMKSKKKLDPYQPAAFDIFDGMNENELSEWKRRMSNRREFENRALSALTSHEKTISPLIILSTVEMTLCKMLAHQKTPMRKARIVLIGDDRQLPPFMYEPNILGHEMAGKSALTVAMKTGRVPLMELNEVYRAPPSIIEPYNRLAYNGTLVSRVVEPSGDGVLSAAGLVPSGQPQLMLINVEGRQERNHYTKSLFNQKEIKTVHILLRNNLRNYNDEIMIICLYKEQQRRLRQEIGNEYTILTVDSAQGKEKPIVILMTTRTQEDFREGSFFKSVERCNVAIREIIPRGRTVMSHQKGTDNCDSSSARLLSLICRTSSRIYPK